MFGVGVSWLNLVVVVGLLVNFFWVIWCDCGVVVSLCWFSFVCCCGGVVVVCM